MKSTIDISDDSNQELAIIKKIRLLEVSKSSSGAKHRVVNRIGELFRSQVGTFAVLKLLLVKTSILAVQKIKQFFKQRQMLNGKSIVEPANDVGSVASLAIRITGGIGDVLCICRWILQVKKEFGEGVEIDIYFQNPGVIRELIHGTCGIREVMDTYRWDDFHEFYDASLTVNQFIQFEWTRFNKYRLIKFFPKFIAFAIDIEKSQIPYRKYMDVHPFLDGAFADSVVFKGLSRKNFLSHISGFSSPSSVLPIYLKDTCLLQKYGIQSKSYITIHDGWDLNFKIASNRPTKAYPLSHWNALVFLLVKNFPDVQIVQLGSRTGEMIEGVHHNLRNKLTFVESAFLLKNSLIHIDSESGLVHLANALGTKSIVLFGPTNINYYGYEENINIAPKACGNCMWTTDSWMEVCPRGLVKPVCMDSISSLQILDAVKAELRSHNALL